jgi:hypothetical protein
VFVAGSHASTDEFARGVLENRGAAMEALARARRQKTKSRPTETVSIDRLRDWLY